MSRISEFKAKYDAFVARQDTAIAGVKGDLDTLNAKIEALQATQGQLTPEDDALLTEIENAADAATQKLEALDALTPPAAPVEATV